MSVLLFISIFFLMEFVAWVTHKYVMHGVLWSWHKDHHVKDYSSGPLEKNDLFFVIFAIPGITFLLLGTFSGFVYGTPIGLGITAYGLCYFLVHDVFIHRRLKWFQKSNNFYFRAVRKAHRMHHKYLTKEDGESFGMLLMPLKYLIGEFKSRKK
jgi:beta-carotene 3-hydroxylase